MPSGAGLVGGGGAASLWPCFRSAVGVLLPPPTPGFASLRPARRARRSPPRPPPPTAAASPPPRPREDFAGA